MIVIGYQGIGKSTICKDNLRYIDFESSALKMFGRRMIGWELPYCQMATWLSKQGYVVFTSSHKEVRKYLTETDEYCIAIVPSLELKKEWVEKLKARYHESDSEKDQKAYLNAKTRYKENIQEIMDDVADTYVIGGMDYDLKHIVAEAETPTNQVDIPTNTPTDLISRQAASDIVYKAYTRDDAMNEIDKLPAVEPKIYGDEHDCMMTMFGECSYSETGCGSCEVVAKVFEALKNECPPVEPERPKGAWREYPLRAGRVELECSECGDTFIRSYGDKLPHFCEHCGADMRGDKE